VLEGNKRLEGKTGKDGGKLEGLLEYFDVGGSPKELMAYMVKSQSKPLISETTLTTRPWATSRLGVFTKWRCRCQTKDDGYDARRLLGVDFRS
jgi:hypothetical protein